jgi:flagellar biogenesis protein FliO
MAESIIQFLLYLLIILVIIGLIVWVVRRFKWWK